MDVGDDLNPCFVRSLTTQKVFYAYTYGTAAWLGLQALPLLFTPRLITTMLSSEAHSITGLPAQAPCL
jgi:hypothetical protein